MSNVWIWLAVLLIVKVFGIPQLSHHPPLDGDRHYFAVQVRHPFVVQSTSSSLIHLDLDDYWSTAPSFANTSHYHDQMLFISQDNPDLSIHGQIGELQGHYLVSLPKISSKLPVSVQMDDHSMHLDLLESHPSVNWALYQTPRWRYRRGLPDLTEVDVLTRQLQIRDPDFGIQWHLVNRENRNGDINVTGVWAMNVTGRGVVVAVIDDGVDMYHEDLKNNFCAEGSYDFNAKTALPEPRLAEDYHGTRCAGEIAAVRNGYCGVGVAYDAKVSGLRILGGPITDVDEALAINYGFQINQLYSCSWGPSDDGAHVDGPNQLVLSAMIKGIREGRGGLGSIFVFATGNGGRNQDNCNYDGYTNSIYGISIGAIDRNNQHASYSEMCSAHLAVTYSSNSDSFIVTTDVRSRNCTYNHAGTSAAAPIAVGILALVMSVRPDLSYRDVQHVTIRGSVPITLEDPDWDNTFAGRKYSHKFGYGKLDAYRAVEIARTWEKVGPHTKVEGPLLAVHKRIPFGPAGIISTCTIEKHRIAKAQLAHVEHVTVTVTIEHQRRGDLDIYLESPNGVRSHVGPRRAVDTSRDGLKNWTFSTVKHWDENPIGEWKLLITDILNSEDQGKLISWKLTIWGGKPSDGRYQIVEDFAGLNAAFVSFMTTAVIVAVIISYFLVRRRRRRQRPGEALAGYVDLEALDIMVDDDDLPLQDLSTGRSRSRTQLQGDDNEALLHT